MSGRQSKSFIRLKSGSSDSEHWGFAGGTAVNDDDDEIEKAINKDT